MTEDADLSLPTVSPDDSTSVEFRETGEIAAAAKAYALAMVDYEAMVGAHSANRTALTLKAGALANLLADRLEEPDSPRWSMHATDYFAFLMDGVSPVSPISEAVLSTGILDEDGFQ